MSGDTMSGHSATEKIDAGIKGEAQRRKASEGRHQAQMLRVQQANADAAAAEPASIEPDAPPQPPMIAATPFHADVVQEITEIGNMLIRKNAAYGDSALDPVRIFSKADSVEQIRVRIDDKISRLQRGAGAGEDAVLDLIGYLVLLRIAEKRRVVA